jgi:cell division protein ZapE
MALIESYNKLVDSGKIKNDQKQREILLELNRLYKNLVELQSNKGGFFSFLLKDRSDREYKNQGIYIHGDVGRGKSMLMDLFYNEVKKHIPSSRIHFHAFMLRIHENLHHLRKSQSKKDYINIICEEIASEEKILCLDELQISDIADAMIVGRIFKGLLELGVNIIITSNRKPDHLYKNGLQRQRFEPFIKLIKNELLILNLDSNTDYRFENIKSLAKVYFTPLGKEADRFIDEAFKKLSEGNDGNKEIINIKGRDILIKKAFLDIAFFSFEDLCDRPLGAEDYLEITKNYKTILISNIPKMAKDDYNLAIRFIKLVDAIYESKTKLICTAEVPVDQLYIEGERSFEFKRTVSRLIEMQSDEYIKQANIS